MVVDFLSRPSLNGLTKFGNYLEGLNFICQNPKFNINNSIEYLRQSVKEMISWLEDKAIIEKFYIPSIELKIDFKIERQDLIKISGNMSKHNFTRLTKVVKDLHKIFASNGINLNYDDIRVSLQEIYDWFYNILGYHASTIAELLNNIRWGIHEYLKPTFKNCYIQTGELYYEYKVPSEIKSDFARFCFWELMNVIRRGPIVRRFVATKYLKMRF